MKMKLAVVSQSHIMGLILVGVFSGAFLKVHLRLQSTIIGYDIGKLKTLESTLLRERSTLQVQLARLTNKDHLELISQNTNNSDKVSSLAAR